MSDYSATLIYQTLLAIAQGTAEQAKILRSTFPQQGGTATSATAGAATLPANPVGFIVVTLPDGTSAKVPYYAD